MSPHDPFRHDEQSQAVLRREGDYWTIAYGASVVRLRDRKGLRYLEHLLRHPGRTFHVCDLQASVDASSRILDANQAEAVERARKAVTNRIRQTVARIRSLHEILGLHLGNAVHTGTRCGYTPDRPISWAE